MKAIKKLQILEAKEKGGFTHIVPVILEEGEDLKDIGVLVFSPDEEMVKNEEKIDWTGYDIQPEYADILGKTDVLCIMVTKKQ